MIRLHHLRIPKAPHAPTEQYSRMDPSDPSPPIQSIANQIATDWNDFLVAALIGLPNTDITHLLFAPPSPPFSVSIPSVPPSAPLDEEAEEAEEAKEPSAKRPCLDAPPITVRRRILRYRYLKLRSGATFRFSDDDGKEILTTASQEPNLYVRKLLSILPHRIKDRLDFLATFQDEKGNEVIDADMEETDEWIVPTAKDLDPFAYLFTNLKEELYTAYLREMRMRRAFRTILQRWRIHRIQQKECNSHDPITLAPPQKPVIVYDMPSRVRYIYDATSLATWIESNLTHHEGGFALPLAPRNPWTNIDFCYEQLVAIYQQLQAHGELRWGLTTLRQHQFNKDRWHLFHRSALTLTAIRKSLTHLDSVDARELLEDFIFAKMEDLHIYTSPSIERAYRRAILRAPHHWYLEEFKAVAYLHYEAEHFGQNRYRSIHNRCDRIFRKQDQFIEEIQRMGILVGP